MSRTLSAPPISIAAAVLSCFTLVLSMSLVSQAATLRVPADYATVCDATAVATFGDTVLVAPGDHIYRGLDCGPIPDGVVVTSEGGAEVTRLYVWQDAPFSRLMEFEAGAGPSTELSGFELVCADFTIYAPIVGPPVIECSGGASPKILNNVIRPPASVPDALSEATGILCASGASPVIRNNTFLGFGPAYYLGDAVAIRVSHSAPTITHNIFVETDLAIHCGSSSASVISCNDYWVVRSPLFGCPPSTGDFSEDPLFCDRVSFDLRLSSESPAAHGYGCGLIGALPVACGPTSTESVSWGTVKSLFR